MCFWPKGWKQISFVSKKFIYSKWSPSTLSVSVPGSTTFKYISTVCIRLPHNNNKQHPCHLRLETDIESFFRDFWNEASHVNVVDRRHNIYIYRSTCYYCTWYEVGAVSRGINIDHSSSHLRSDRIGSSPHWEHLNFYRISRGPLSYLSSPRPRSISLPISIVLTSLYILSPRTKEGESSFVRSVAECLHWCPSRPYPLACN